MKKLSLFLTCALLASSGAFAQKNVVESVGKKISDYNADFKAARTELQPALTNSETKDQAQTWFVAGKTEFGQYDQLLGKKQLKQAVDNIEMGNALMNGYNYFVKALKLDSVPEMDKNGTPKLDKNGNKKYKTKYSKDIINAISGHFNDFSNVASDYYDKKEFKKAYEAWNVFTSLPKNGMLGKNAPVVPDSVIGQVQFFQGIAAWQGGDNKIAVESFNKAKKNGYTKKEVYDYALSNYVALNDNDGIVATAKEAFPLYGTQDSQYISILINDFINKKQYEEAKGLLDKAIEKNPNNAEFYDVKGTLYENQNDPENALKYFMKAIELKPDYAKGQYDVGRYYYNQAVKMNEKTDKNLTASQLKRAFEANVKPLYNKALPYMKKAYELDTENKEVKHALRNIYYLLGMEAELNALEQNN